MVMVNNMTNQNYLMVQENVVINVCVWDGNTQTWQPPVNTTMLIQATTPTKIWGLNQEGTEYVLVDSIGNANIGFTWDGAYCVTNQPQPSASVTE
jgi:hypothetical protein